MHPSITLLSDHQSSRGALYMDCMNRSVVLEPTTMGTLLGVVGSQISCLPGPAYCIDCWPLVGGARSQHGWLWGPGHPRAAAHLLVCETRS